MATYKPRKEPKPIEIERFLGLNESVGETEIVLGEATNMENFRITKNYKAQKRPGHYTFVNTGGGAVQAIWIGELGGDEIMAFCHGGNVYRYDMTVTTSTVLLADLITEGTVTTIGTITDVKTSITWFDNKIIFLNGTDYKEYDGTTYQDVPAYVPTIALASPPAGGGTPFEEINLLTGKKEQEFVGDGSSTLYQLAETSIDSVVSVTVDGVLKAAPADYSVNLALGQVTFVVAPINEAKVEIVWDKANATNVALVKNHKYIIDYGVGNDTNLFIFGNVNEKHVFRYSGINKAGYFPANAFVACGSNEFAITDLKPHYQSLLVFKERSTKIVKPTPNPEFTNNTGLNPYNFPYFDLNENVGNLAPNMVQLVENSPISLFGFSMWAWSSSQVEDERNAQIISDRVKLSLQGLNLANAVTFDYQHQKEYWVNVGDKVYIWNYGNNTFYIYTNVNAHKFLEYEADIFYTQDGGIERFKEEYISDGQALGDTIPCVMKLGFSTFGVPQFRKVMRDEWIAIDPASRTSVDVTFVTDRKNESESKSYVIEYKLIDFNNIDFNDWSFLTNTNPQPKRLRAKVKKFTYLQMIFENNTNNEVLTVLSAHLQAQIQGYSR